MKTTFRFRIRNEKTSWKSRLSFITVIIFFHAKNHAFFKQKMLVSRIINREDDHFDRFKIQIEFFVWFFLKFIESDRFLWMKNAVNCKWWMRKWIVKKTKMKCKKIFVLKKDFFFFVFDQTFFSLRFSILLFFLSIFFVCSKNLFWSFRDVICVKFFFD